MKRPEKHHHTLPRTVLQFIKHKGLIKSGQHVIVAVSGGIDSMVLLDLLAKQRDVFKLRLSVAHVNFGLRGRASNTDELFVTRQSETYRIPCFTARVECARYAATRKISIQEAARELRYEFFENLKKSQKGERIAVAHNADDNVETMLFNFFRGSGLQGVAGIPVRRGAVIRPLLCVTRKEIERYAATHDIRFREDASNLKQEYTRNFIRKTIVPGVQQRINPSLTRTLQKESEIFTSLAGFVDEETKRCRTRAVSGSSIILQELRNLHPFLQHAVVKALLEEMGVEPSFPVIDAVVGLQTHQKGSIVEVGSRITCERTADRITFRRRIVQKGFSYTLPSAATISNERFTFSVEPAHDQNKTEHDPSVEYVDAAAAAFPLTVRSWKPGDAFVPLGMKGTKKLSDFFGEKKLTAEEKSEVPIVLSGDSIVWVGGLRLDDRCKITENTRSTLKLTVHIHGKENDRRQ